MEVDLKIEVVSGTKVTKVPRGLFGLHFSGKRFESLFVRLNVDTNVDMSSMDFSWDESKREWVLAERGSISSASLSACSTVVPC